jgi:hypothetical protein
MGFFDATIAAALAGRVVRTARLVEMDFADGAARLWEGGTGLIKVGGLEWQGAGELGSISGIESALGGTAPQVTLALSGIAASFVGEMVASETNVKGRDVTIYFQFFDEDWTPLDNPYAVFLGLMDVMTAKIKSPTSATIELTCEGIFTRRSRPVWGYLSDRSQQALYPGDTGLSRMSYMRLAAPFWPVF